MADSNVTNKIRSLKEKIAEQQNGRDEWAQQLPGLDELVALGGPEGEEAAQMKAEAEETVAGYDKELAKLNAELAKLEATLPKAPEPAAPKFDPEKHPLLKKASEKAEVAKPVVFSTGDLCEAQWTDRQWYKVKIQTVLGSSSDPKYHVRFLDYQDSTLTVGRDAIRPLMNEKKRKAEAVPTTPTTAPATSSHVISGPASMNLQHPANKQATEVDTSVPINRRKIGGAKALERKASSWKDFQKKGPGKMVTKKESMFRTGEGPNSRVGFTGSGVGMTKAPKRVRYNMKLDEAEGDEDDGFTHSRGSKGDYPSRGRH